MKPILGVALALLALPAAAQDNDPDDAVTGVPLPAGWAARADRGSMDNVNFRTMGTGVHATLGPAAIFWRTDDRAEGNYTITAAMTQTQAPRHPEAYGIFLGGNDLQGDGQAYLYFLVRGAGEYLVRSRTGTQVSPLNEGGWTRHEAIVPADTTGRQTNELSVRVADGTVTFMVNGQSVWSGQQPTARTNGTFGLRVNHNLDVHIEGPART